MADIFGYTPNSCGRYPSNRRVASLLAIRSSPSSVAVPVSGSSKVARIFMKVDLPAPFGPISPNMPGGISSETPRRARTPPGYVLARLRMESTRSAPFSTSNEQSFRDWLDAAILLTRTISERLINSSHQFISWVLEAAFQIGGGLKC